MNRCVSVACRVLVWVTALVLLVGCIPVCLSVQAEGDLLPLVVLAEGGAEIQSTVCSGTPTFFLPGYMTRGAVTVMNVGKGPLYFPASKLTLAVGKTAMVNMAADMLDFEYTADSQVQGKFYAQVLEGSNKVPSLYISLDNRTTLSWLHEDKDNKGGGSLLMLDRSGKTVYNGKLDTIKGRGNTSFTHPGKLAPDKKSYNIKLEQKTELIAGAGKAKKWALIHMRVDNSFMKNGRVGYDWTGLCNLLGYQTYSALMGTGYGDIKARFVDLYIDDDYRGVYILAERVDVNAALDIYDPEEYIRSASDEHEVCFDNSDPAIKAGVRYFQYTADAIKIKDFDITGGYLLEVNTDKLEEPCGFETERGMLVDIKAPEACTKEQVSYIACRFQQFEDALYAESGFNEEGRHYSEYIDMDSLAGLLVTCAFFKNWELFRTSTYMYLDTADSDHPKLTFGPAWDFETGAYMLANDSTLYNKHQLYVDTHSQCYHILGQLTTKGDIQRLMLKKAQELNKILFATVGTGSYQGVANANALWRDAVDSLEMNWIRWNYEISLEREGGTFAGHDNTYTYYAEEFVTALKTRWDNWKKLWNENNYLLGVTVERPAANSHVLSAEVNGKANSYQWCRLVNGYQLEEIPRATMRTYMVQETGVYYCIVTGNNNAFCGESLSEILSEQTISMISSPVYVEIAGKTPGGTTIAPPGFISGSTTRDDPDSGATDSTTVPADPVSTQGTSSATVIGGETTSTTQTQVAEPSVTGTTAAVVLPDSSQLPPSMQQEIANEKAVRIVVAIGVPVLTLAALCWIEWDMLIRLLQRMIHSAAR